MFADHQDKFLYLNQGESPFIDGVNDCDSFEETLQALNTLGFSRMDQENTFKILSAILHLGNVTIKKEDEGSHIKASAISKKFIFENNKLSKKFYFTEK